MIRSSRRAGLVLAALASGTAVSHGAEILASRDYMSSGFFTSDFLRGEEPDSSRSSNRATSPSVFGIDGENAYFEFDFDPSAFTGPVTSAVFMVESVGTGFFGDPSPSNPAEVSLHRLTSDPLAAVDQSLASGAGSWLDFRDTQITHSSIVSTTTVDGLGVYAWDVTAMVNEWIANGNTNFAYTLGTSVLMDEDTDTAVAFVNSSWAGLGSELTARIVVVPAPATGGLLAMAGLIAARRRRNA